MDNHIASLEELLRSMDTDIFLEEVFGYDRETSPDFKHYREEFHQYDEFSRLLLEVAGIHIKKGKDSDGLPLSGPKPKIIQGSIKVALETAKSKDISLEDLKVRDHANEKDLSLYEKIDEISQHPETTIVGRIMLQKVTQQITKIFSASAEQGR